MTWCWVLLNLTLKFAVKRSFCLAKRNDEFTERVAQPCLVGGLIRTQSCSNLFLFNLVVF